MLCNKSDISLSKKISMGSAVTGKQSSVSFATSSSRSIDRFALRHGKQCKHVQVNNKQQRNQKSRLGAQMPGPILLGSSPKPHPRNFLEGLVQLQFVDGQQGDDEVCAGVSNIKNCIHHRSTTPHPLHRGDGQQNGWIDAVQT